MNLSPASIDVARRIVEEVRVSLVPNDPDFLPIVEAETDVLECIRRVLRVARIEESEALGLQTLMDTLALRKRRKDTRADGLRRLAMWAMQQLKLKRLDGDDMTVTLRPGKPALLIPDESLIPTQLRKPGKPDRAAIRKSLEAGEAVPGASLAETAEDILTVRNS